MRASSFVRPEIDRNPHPPLFMTSGSSKMTAVSTEELMKDRDLGGGGGEAAVAAAADQSAMLRGGSCGQMVSAQDDDIAGGGTTGEQQCPKVTERKKKSLYFIGINLYIVIWRCQHPERSTSRPIFLY